ncbi:MAG: class I SAM-dependent methyltransferase [Candidatus Woesearchaeota archaeon]
MDEQDQWNQFAGDYNERVYSITSFPEKVLRIIHNVREGRQLIVGCGSATNLNQALMDFNKGSVVAADYSREMLKKAERDCSSARITYIYADTRNLPFKDEFDTVISTNSILPEEPEDAGKMFEQIYGALKPGGRLVAYLPSFDSNEKLKAQFPEYSLETDPHKKRVWDTTGWQTFHTKESLESMLQKFSRVSIEKVGIESEAEAAEMERIYGFDYRGRDFFEYFVVAEK